MDIFQEEILKFSKKYKEVTKGLLMATKLSQIKRDFSEQLSNPPYYSFEYLGLYGLFYRGLNKQEYAWLDLKGHNMIEFMEEYRKNNDLAEDEDDFLCSLEGKSS